MPSSAALHENHGSTTITRTRTQQIALCALCVALLVASCFFTVPFGPVPFTLQTAVVILIALLFSPAEAAAITGVYLLMGAIGLPVFSGMTGGIIRATSGFLFSYLIGSATASLVRGTLTRHGVRQVVADVLCGLTVIVISDVLGWAWFMFFNDLSPLAAFLAADAPFIVIDCCKMVLSVAVATAVRKALRLG